MDINAQIQQIIKNRVEIAEKVRQLKDQWNARLNNTGKLQTRLQEIKIICDKALTSDELAGEDLSSFQKLRDYLNSVAEQQILEGNRKTANYVLTKLLAKLSERFDRKTINIAVAGVGRCGKSTALKAIIGQDQKDNSIIPSGNGTAVTAGKSTIRCVATEEEEKTTVFYHSEKSFLDDVVNPILADIASPRCNDLDEFEKINIDELAKILDNNQKEANEKVQKAQNDFDKQGTPEARQAVDQAKAYAHSFRQKTTHLSDLQKICTAYKSFRMNLTGEKEDIPLKNTYKYISYPPNGEPAYCYAVKECVIYSRFPNNTVQSLQLIDLPGIGTQNLSEHKCFLEGFNYSVDLAMIIRRPEGVFQNFPTDDDLNVIHIIDNTFGQEHLHKCALLFQNDANLPQADTEAAYKAIEEWNAKNKPPLSVISGNAFDSNDMQNRILPFVLQFILGNLPKFDRTLLECIRPELENSSNEVDRRYDEVRKTLDDLKKAFKTKKSSTNNVYKYANELRNRIMNGIQDIYQKYEKTDSHISKVQQKIEELSNELRNWSNVTFNHQDVNQINKVRDEISKEESPIPFAIRKVHNIRIHISEVYAKMEKIHMEIIKELHNELADVFKKNLPTLIDEKKTLEDVAMIFEKTGCCDEIVDTLNSFLSLKVPFYSTIYPAMRKSVFDDINTVVKYFKDAHNDKPDIILGELNSFAHQWIHGAQQKLQGQDEINKINEILLASIERLMDRLCRNSDTEDELRDFIEQSWSKIQGNRNSYTQDVYAKLNKIAH